MGRVHIGTAAFSLVCRWRGGLIGHGAYPLLSAFFCRAFSKRLVLLPVLKARRELLEKFDIVEAGAYRNSMSKFNEHGFTSTVEYIALRRAEIQAEYEERKKQIEAMFEKRERKCL